MCVLTHVQLFATPWTVAQKAPLSMGFSRQEYWSGLTFPSLGDLPDSGIDSRLLRLLYRQVDYFPLAPPGKPLLIISKISIIMTTATLSRSKMALRQQRTALKSTSLVQSMLACIILDIVPEKLMAHGVKTHNRSKTASSP